MLKPYLHGFPLRICVKRLRHGKGNVFVSLISFRLVGLIFATSYSSRSTQHCNACRLRLELLECCYECRALQRWKLSQSVFKAVIWSFSKLFFQCQDFLLVLLVGSCGSKQSLFQVPHCCFLGCFLRPQFIRVRISLFRRRQLTHTRCFDNTLKCL